MVALLNIEIPQIMGGAINVIARFSDTKDSKLFIEEMKGPALKLISMYLAQVSVVVGVIFFVIYFFFVLVSIYVFLYLHAFEHRRKNSL